MKRMALISAAAIAISAHAWAAENVDAGIQKAKDQLVAAFNKGDAVAVAHLYTEQAYLLPPGAPMLKGRAAIQDYWESGFKGGAKNLALTVGKVDQLGDAAREIAQFSFDSKDGKVEGKYVGIWKPEYGAWKLDTDVWNMNK